MTNQSRGPTVRTLPSCCIPQRAANGTEGSSRATPLVYCSVVLGCCKRHDTKVAEWRNMLCCFLSIRGTYSSLRIGYL
ncbi:hypothetical protein NC652_026850 [Populus alba x Populus x berolinensis]|nr:hypothetical protein NC651_025767 [Populus alba x Populus x berolinensis]KAJ6900880.1 hypothetical protein NC652_026850 [Populus alba x Populus x berolinensis]